MADKNQNQTLHTLLKKYREGTCSAEEKQAIEQWFSELPDSTLADPHAPGHLAESIYKRFESQLTPHSQPVPIKKHARRIGIGIAAASVALFLWAGISYFSALETNAPSAEYLSNDIRPAESTAILRDEEGIEIAKPDPNLKTYSKRKPQRFQLSTPIASTYQVQLEDGTSVWLNAESSLSYPSAFSPNERRVQLTGEAYFDVKPDAKRPFIIEVAETTIEVLGTAFNVSAYQEEVITTLVEGSVKVTSADQQGVLRPGEQARSQHDLFIVKTSNLDKDLAWQRGEFYFDGNNLQEVCREISRWYDVEFENLQQPETTSSFRGSIDRNQNLSKVLNILSIATGQAFKISGRKIVTESI